MHLFNTGDATKKYHTNILNIYIDPKVITVRYLTTVFANLISNFRSYVQPAYIPEAVYSAVYNTATISLKIINTYIDNAEKSGDKKLKKVLTDIANKLYTIQDTWKKLYNDYTDEKNKDKQLNVGENGILQVSGYLDLLNKNGKNKNDIDFSKYTAKHNGITFKLAGKGTNIDIKDTLKNYINAYYGNEALNPNKQLPPLLNVIGLLTAIYGRTLTKDEVQLVFDYLTNKDGKTGYSKTLTVKNTEGKPLPRPLKFKFSDSRPVTTDLFSAAQRSTVAGSTKDVYSFYASVTGDSTSGPTPDEDAKNRTSATYIVPQGKISETGETSHGDAVAAVALNLNNTPSVSSPQVNLGLTKLKAQQGSTKKDLEYLVPTVGPDGKIDTLPVTVDASNASGSQLTSSSATPSIAPAPGPIDRTEYKHNGSEKSRIQTPTAAPVVRAAVATSASTGAAAGGSDVIVPRFNLNYSKFVLKNNNLFLKVDQRGKKWLEVPSFLFTFGYLAKVAGYANKQLKQLHEQSSDK